ncbi:MAG TPA: DUF924 family protein, partial [Myxococcota bacterium]|nr:DUF924 family protein [Myxococcota bacterium]
MSDGPEAVLAFWFADATASPERAAERMPFWFDVNEGVDREIRERFGALLERAGGGELASWEDAPRSALALVIVLDQFSRNM